MQGIHFGTWFWDELETLLKDVDDGGGNKDEQWEEKKGFPHVSVVKCASLR